MSKLFCMDESGKYRELCKLSEIPEITDDSDVMDASGAFISLGTEQEVTLECKCDVLKDFAVYAGINICHSCGRIGPLPFPHMNGVTYCPECLIKRMK